ncbi:hypothetical protein BDD12DRAFT_839167 [Trichophaea hybrida]|nr:hypothetical protein BDD12DRAFT_839167 [Trichophaea hybrida]
MLNPQQPELGQAQPSITQQTESNLPRADFNRPETNQPESNKLETGQLNSNFLAVMSDAPLGLCLAQDVFSAFMWAVAKKTEPLDGETTVHPTSTPSYWKSFRLENTTLMKMAKDIQRAGLGSLEDAYINIVPPLSVNRKLPAASCIIEFAKETARYPESIGHWEEAMDVYL